MLAANDNFIPCLFHPVTIRAMRASKLSVENTRVPIRAATRGKASGVGWPYLKNGLLVFSQPTVVLGPCPG